ncbi:hypothetical protein DYB38_005868 [Aphanomyces astaci]|uniref:GAF domain-containing protein n=1 Tax=Aphanomyces astaci TaxID=112090 RepID=A0A397CLE6_APHAT|nr:hypothetical protein DYB38_005868 [Aphanomyces astaci]
MSTILHGNQRSVSHNMAQQRRSISYTRRSLRDHHHHDNLSSSPGSPFKAFFASQEFSADDYPSPDPQLAPPNHDDPLPPRGPRLTHSSTNSWPYPWEAPPVLPHEAERLNVLDSYEVLDTTPEHVFDMLCAMVVKALKVPIGGISFLDKSRQWCKSSIGLKQTVIPRNVAFCAHTIASPSPLVVLDASLDKRFYMNPLVTGPANLQFYAGAPLVNPAGFVLGTVFVYGHNAEEAVDVAILVKIAKMAMNHLEDRRRAAVSEVRGAPPPHRHLRQPSSIHQYQPFNHHTVHHESGVPPPPHALPLNPRQEALRTLDILDMPSELVFDRISGLASTLMQCPIAGVSLLDEDKQWFKASHVGDDDTVDLADVAEFCVHVVASTRPLVVLNAADDARFRKHPLVKRRTNPVRFVAAVPVVTADGHVIGTVFVMDTVVRQAGHVDLRSLQRLAKVAMLHLSQRITYAVTPIVDYSSFLDERAHVYDPNDVAALQSSATAGSRKQPGGFQRLRTRFLSRFFGRQ